MEAKPNYYAIIPANVRYDKELTPNAKLLYGEITSLCNEKGYCWATNDYFAKLYGVSKVSISKWVKLLTSNGYLQSVIKYKEGSKEILHRYLTIVGYPIKEKFNTPIKEKFKDNTKPLSNNKTNTKSNNVRKEILKLIEQSLGRPFGSLEIDLINSWLSNYNFTLEHYELLVKSIKKAEIKKQSKLPLSYYSTILFRWNDGNKSLEEIAQEIAYEPKSKKQEFDFDAYCEKMREEDENDKRANNAGDRQG